MTDVNERRYRRDDLTLTLKHHGNGTLASPDVYACPACGADMIEGYDEDNEGRFFGDGTFACPNQHYIDEDGLLSD